MSQTAAGFATRGNAVSLAFAQSAEPRSNTIGPQKLVTCQHFIGHEALLQRQSQLVALAARCEQAGLLDHLAFFLSVPYFGDKVPHLLLWSDATGETSAAVMVHEYVLAGRRTGVFIAADATGERTVVSSPQVRFSVAARAAELLFSKGAHIVLLSIADGGAADIGAAASSLLPHRTIATQTRTLRRDLPVSSSYDQTLAAMGAHTRRNLRCYVRRAKSAYGACFVPQAQMSGVEFQQLNLRCSYPVPDGVAAWRYESAHSAARAFFSGLRGRDGSWLSLVGGRRFTGARGTTSVIDWQMNQTCLPNASLGTVMRGFLLENEILQGNQILRFEGGTPHSMRSAFLPEPVTDVLLARPGLSLRLLRAMAPLLPSGGFLAETLGSKDLR